MHGLLVNVAITGLRLPGEETDGKACKGVRVLLISGRCGTREESL